MPRTGVLLALLTTVVPGVLFGSSVTARQHSHAASVRFVCPMHAEVTASTPGTCTVCGMALERVDPDAAHGHRLEVTTAPAAVEAGRPFTIVLTVRAEGQREPVSAFTVVHEKPFHLFVISRDLEHYNHLHPSQDRTGAWVQELTLAQPGEYKVYADVLPKGGTPQVLQGSLEVKAPSGVQGVSEAPARHPEPDGVLEQTIGGLRVRLSVPGGGLVAAGRQPLTFHFADARTGAAVQDIEPYLGAWGHTVMVSADTEHFVHAHPAEPLTARFGGPQLTFHAAPPEPGVYRMWTQIKRQGRVETIVFTLPVKSDR